MFDRSRELRYRITAVDLLLTFTFCDDASLLLAGQDHSAFNRHMSVDSVNSYNSLTSQQSTATDTADGDKKKKRRNWVRCLTQ